MELFWKQGYEKASMSDLVEYMGIHRKTLYDTFGDKQSLFLKALDCFGARLNCEASRAETAKQYIQFIFDLMIEGSGDNRHLGCLFVNAATELALRDIEVNEKTEEAFIRAERLLADLILKGQQTGEFSWIMMLKFWQKVCTILYWGLGFLQEPQLVKKITSYSRFFLSNAE